MPTAHLEFPKIFRSVPVTEKLTGRNGRQTSSSEHEFIHMRESSFTVETAKPVETDARLVMKWRNDPVSLASFFHRTPKIWETFWQEFQSDYFSNQNPTPIFCLVDGVRFGFLRFNRLENTSFSNTATCDISINLDSSVRGQGLGVKALILAEHYIRTLNYDQIYAEIRIENTASIKSFEKAGYQRLDQIIKHIDDTGEDCKIFRYLLKVHP